MWETTSRTHSLVAQVYAAHVKDPAVRTWSVACLPCGARGAQWSLGASRTPFTKGTCTEHVLPKWMVFCTSGLQQDSPSHLQRKKFRSSLSPSMYTTHVAMIALALFAPASRSCFLPHEAVLTDKNQKQRARPISIRFNSRDLSSLFFLVLVCM